MPPTEPPAPDRTADKGPRGSFCWDLVWPALPVLLLAGWLVGVRLPLGYAREWAWPVRSEPAPLLPWLRWLLWVMAGSGLGAILIRWSRRPSRWRTALRALALSWLMLGGMVACWLAAAIHLSVPHWLVSVSWSAISNEYFSAAYQIEDLPTFLRTYPERMRKGHYHLATHPPGSVLFYYAAVRCYESQPWLRRTLEGLLSRSDPDGIEGLVRFARRFPTVPELPRSAVGGAVFSALCLLLLAFTSVPSVYGWLCATTNEESAWRGAWTVALLPALCFFGVGLDGVLVGLTAALCLLWERALRAPSRAGRLGWSCAAGLLWCGGISVSVGLLAVLPLLGMVAWLRREGRRPLLERGLAFAAGACLPIAVAAAWGVPVATIALTGLTAHRGVTVESFRRSYSIWLLLNLVDVVLFAGGPLVLAWLVSLGRAWRTWERREGAAWSWALAATLLLLDLSGVVRAETGRIWMFLYPPLVVAWAARTDSGEGLIPLWQSLQLALMLLWMPPLLRPF